MVGLTPLEKLRHSPPVSCPGVFVSDVGGKEFDKAPGGVGAGVGDRAGQVLEPGSGELSATIRGDFLGHAGWAKDRIITCFYEAFWFVSCCQYRTKYTHSSLALARIECLVVTIAKGIRLGVQQVFEPLSQFEISDSLSRNLD